ncbi:AsmA-like C-terminal region-containing protein [Novipirellula caenicola]|uniref:AsmA-like C-terminal domain-containing protein n=1 Tax=Novipirellula caenicola TaxID=1536901 RepID=A0ABP9W1X8_9BACT
MMMRPAEHSLARWIRWISFAGMLGIMLAWGGGTEVSAQAPPAARPKPAAAAKDNTRYWTTSWDFDSVDVKRLSERLKRLGIGIPIEMEGAVSVNLNVSVPLTALTDAKKYRLEGLVRSPRLKLEQLVLEDFQTHVQIADGVMTVDQINGRLIDAAGPRGARQVNRAGAGRVTGAATLQLSPLGQIDAAITTESVAIQPLHQLILAIQARDDQQPLHGVVSGEIQFQAPLKSIREIQSWNATTQLRIDSLARGDALPLDIPSASISIADGVLMANDLQIRSSASADLSASLQGRIELNQQQRFSFAVRANDLPLDTLAQLAGANANRFAAGQVDLDATATGELAQSKWTMAGRVASPRLSIAGVQLGLIEHAFEFDQQHFKLAPIGASGNPPRDDLIVQNVQANYTLQDRRWVLSQIDAQLFGGEISGEASVALDKQDSSTLNLSWQGLSPNVNAQLFSLADVVISASSSGKIDWTLPAGDWSRLADQSGNVQVQLDSIKVGDADIGQMDLVISKSDDALKLTADGNLFGGDVKVETQSDVTADMTWQDLWQRPSQIRLSVNRIRIDRLVMVMPQQSWLVPRFRQLRGLVSADIELDGALGASQQDAPLRSTAGIQLDHLSLGTVLITHRLEIALRTRGSSVDVDKVSGIYAGGRITARGQWDVLQNDGHIDVQVASVDASPSIRLLSEQVADFVEGKLSGQFHVTGGGSIRARGAVQAHDAVVAGIPVGDANSGMIASYSLGSGQWDASFSSIHGEVARGRLRGFAKLKSSYRPNRFDLASQWSFERVNFAKFIADAGGGSFSYANGQVRGKLTLGGEAIASSDDLRGSFSTELDGSQASAIPGLSEAQRFLGAVPLAGIRIEDGQLSGTITRGRARIDEFVLSSPQLKVWADGYVQLDNLRMDVEAVISTGNFQASQVMEVYLQIASFTSLSPVALFIRINQLLSNRTIYVDVGGTLYDPKLRLRPLATLRDEVARYIVSEVLGLNCAVFGSENPFQAQN